MKLGLCLEMALTSLPFEDRVKTAAQLGFKYVEIWWVNSFFKGTPGPVGQVGACQRREHYEYGHQFAGRLSGQRPDGSAPRARTHGWSARR